MKIVDLSAENPTLDQLLRLAKNESVILRTPRGREFVIAKVEDFDQEIARVIKK